MRVQFKYLVILGGFSMKHTSKILESEFYLFIDIYPYPAGIYIYIPCPIALNILRYNEA